MSTAIRVPVREAVPLWQTPGRQGTIPAWFEEQARRTPTAPALTEAGGGQWTYAQLDARANGFAHWLRESGVRPGDTVGLHLARSRECVAAMLGVLKAGAAYLPLEPHVHRGRLEAYVADARPVAVVTADPAAAAGFGAPVLDLTGGAVDRQPDGPVPVEVTADDVVYVTYTSGSTGRPKGTLVPHRAIPGFFRGADYACWGPDSVSVLHCALAWDGHLADLYPPLLTGGRVVIPAHDTADPLATAQCAAEHGVTVLFMTTAAFNLLALAETAPATVPRYLLFGGEAASPEHTREIARRYPDTRLVNCYGPSEATVFTTAHPVREADLAAGLIPIGARVGDREVRVLDERMRLCPPGEVGELHVAGPALGHGYLGRAALTAGAFVPDPYAAEPGARMYRTGDLVRQEPDGTITFVGRRDTQVKIRGFRIELGEIEAVVHAHPDVASCAVTTWEAAPGDRRLAAHLTVRDGRTLDEAALRGYLAERLPDYMVPGTFGVLDALPLTANGKVDRKALSAPPENVPAVSAGPVGPAEPAGLAEPAAHPSPDAAADPLRELVGLTWAKVLGVDRVHDEDNVAALGGHSLLAVRLVHVLRAALGVNGTLASLVGSLDLAQFTGQVRETIAREGAAPDLPGILARLTR